MSTLKVGAITDASGGNTATINSMTPTADSLQGFRNRIINGGMVIDQRNAGASVTPTTDNTYMTDRWISRLGIASKFSFQQSSTAPTGFANSLLFTSASANTPSSGDYYAFAQYIEGFNFADANFGTANAKTVTLSFWVRSSLTGTFSGILKNSAYNRSYPFQFTISSANTFEYKTITISGDTSGTWVGSTNGIGCIVGFNLGCGSTYLGTAGAWAGSNLWGSTGTTNILGTNGATFYITGVQLEVGSTATPFERRPYGTELMLCQRYFQKSYKQSDAVGTVTQDGMFRMYMNGLSSFTVGQYNIFFKTSFRATPTLTGYSPETGASGKYRDYNASTDRDFTAYYTTTEVSAWQNASITGTTTPNIGAQWTASSEL